MKAFGRLVSIIGPALCWVPLLPAAATPVHKCSVNGAVTYQRDPCAAGKPGRQPSVETLNAERQQRQRQAGDDAVRPPASRRPGSSVDPAPAVQVNAERRAKQPAAGAFGCDGRMRCSQMTSCAEATYFLKHCPGVQMDGDRDGIPCEDQWCAR